MSSESPNAPAIQEPTSDKSIARKKKRRKQRQVTCQVCHQTFATLTAAHLREQAALFTGYIAQARAARAAINY